MFHFFMPLVPLTLAGALFFKRKTLAYGLPILLVLTRALLTQPSLIEFFTVSSLLITVFAVRVCRPGQAAEGRQDMPSRAVGAGAGQNLSVLKISGMAFLAILVYEVFSNFGVWALGGCLPEQAPLYAYSFSGLWECYQAALPYMAVHFIRDIPLCLGAVKLFELVAKTRPAVHEARQNA